MKITIKRQMLLIFITFVVFLSILQIVLNLFFAEKFYIQQKSEVIKQACYQISDSFDGTLESVQDIIYNYEIEHGLNIVLITDQQPLYNSRLTDVSNKLDYGYNTGHIHSIQPDDQITIQGNIDPHHSTRNPVLDISPPSNNLKPQLSGNNSDSTLHLNTTFMSGGQSVYCTIALPLPAITAGVQVITDLSLYTTCLLLIIGIIFALFISKSFAKPICDIDEIANTLANLDFSAKANENLQTVELSNLAKSINSMSTNLESSIQKLQADVDYHKQLDQMRQDFIANVSHEMKTPLALLRLYASNLQEDIAGIDKNFYYQTIDEEATHLSEMVTSMLEVSSVESGMYQMDLVPIDLSAFSVNILDKFSPMLVDINLTHEIQENISVLGDSKHLEQVAKNYITNALSHTKHGDEISITLSAKDGKATFAVYNQGQHIADDDMPQLWDSFYRSDKARLRNNHNVGLGLYIAKTIIEKHNGTYDAKNLPNGVQFSVTLTTL